MRGLARYTQILPPVVLSLVFSGAVEGQQQASPDRAAWADGTAGLIEHHQQPGLALARNAGRASRIRPEPGQGTRSDQNGKETGDDNNNNNVRFSETFPQDAPRLQTLMAMAPPGEVRATHDGRVAGSTVTAQRLPPAFFPAAPPQQQQQQDRGEGPPSRLLQDDGSCAVGDTFTVSSTVYNAANGCYFTLAEEDPYTFVSVSSSLGITVGDRLLLPSNDLFTDFPNVWLMAEVYDVSSVGYLVSLECQSSELIEDAPHPSDAASWFCVIAGDLQLVAAETFGITCGCDGSDSSGATPPPASTVPTPVDADSPEGTSGCGGTDPFAIVSGQLTDLDGCYQDTGGDDGDTFFSQTGEKADGVLAVYPAPFDEQEFDLRWIVGVYSLTADNATVDCISDEAPSEAHPADSIFYCDLTGTGAYTTVTTDQFSVVCGCDGTTAPTDSPFRDIDFGFDTPAPAGDEAVEAATTPSPAGSGEDADIAADGTSGGGLVAPAPPSAWLSAMVAAVLMAVWMPQ